MAEWLADHQQQADLYAERTWAGAVAERRVAEALRQASEPDPAVGRQEPGGSPVAPAERARERADQDQEFQRESEDDFGDSWRAYRERADQIRRTYGWTVPQPPPRAEPWLPLGRDDQERDRDREDR